MDEIRKRIGLFSNKNETMSETRGVEKLEKLLPKLAQLRSQIGQDIARSRDQVKGEVLLWRPDDDLGQ